MKKQPKYFNFLHRFVIVLSIICCLSLVHQSDLAATENYSPFQFNSNSEYWPTNGWKSSLPERVGMSSEKILDMFDKIEGITSNIDTILIVRNGFIVIEASKQDLNRQHPIYSSTKSVTSTLFGIALSKGYIDDLNQPALEFIE